MTISTGFAWLSSSILIGVSSFLLSSFPPVTISIVPVVTLSPIVGYLFLQFIYKTISKEAKIIPKAWGKAK